MAISLTNVFLSNTKAISVGVAAPCNGLAAYSMDVELGSPVSATITFQGLIADLGGAAQTWRTVGAYPAVGGGLVTTTSADGTFIIPCAGLSQVRANLTAYTGPGTGVYVQGYGSYAPRWQARR